MILSPGERILFFTSNIKAKSFFSAVGFAVGKAEAIQTLSICPRRIRAQISFFLPNDR